MSEILVAKRYAQALFDGAVQGGETAAVDADILLIDESLAGSAELVRFFRSPVVSRERKAKTLKALFGERVSARTMDFIQLLVGKRREGIFPEIIQAYRKLRDDQQGVAAAHARSAKPLGEVEKEGLKTALERLTGKKVRLDVSVDPSLIGGVVVKVGDTVFDGSVQNQLATLRSRFLHGTISNN